MNKVVCATGAGFFSAGLYLVILWLGLIGLSLLEHFQMLRPYFYWMRMNYPPEWFKWAMWPLMVLGIVIALFRFYRFFYGHCVNFWEDE